MTNELTDATLNFLKTSPVAERKLLGQYMTPHTIGVRAASSLPLEKGAKILDPAVGTGELLRAVQSLHPDLELELHGWDVDETIMETAEVNVPEGIYRNQSVHTSIDQKWLNHFDAIIGNPPYFELKRDEYDAKRFSVAGGRTNIYSLFFEAYLPLLKEGGYLAYIVPPSMNAGAYFENLRKYITQNSEIVSIELIRENKQFLDALTSVQIIVLKKTSAAVTHNNVLDFTELTTNPEAPTVFTDNETLIRSQWADRKSLYDYGYEAVTGTIPWNQYKASLFEDDEPGESRSILYYAKDISKDNTLVLSDKVADRRWLKTTRPALTGKTILVNRIVGSLDNPKLKAVLVDGDNYFAENHVNVIRPRAGTKQLITIEQLHEKIVTRQNLTDYLKALTGNTQLSAKELQNLIPV